MDDKEKNVIEQIVDKVNDFVEDIASTASDALDQAIEQTAVKQDGQPTSDGAANGNDAGLRSDKGAYEESGQTAIR